ncbi:MAG: hypothetical protein U0936_11645 [Planctomycetaceae bacterium]
MHIPTVTVVGMLLYLTGNLLCDEPRTDSANVEQKTETTEAIFSGPQVGEELAPFLVRGVFDEYANREFNYVELANGRPVVLIFIHDVNRQSISLARILATYTNSRTGEGLVTGMILLNDDATEAESLLKRMRHAIGPVTASIASANDDGKNEAAKNIEYATVATSIDGREGPGSYGLNRNVTLTILVGNENKVTANFALIQPSLQVDLPKILESVISVIGGEVPKLEDLEGMPATMKQRDSKSKAPEMRPLLGPLIRLDATEEQVVEAAARIEAAAMTDPAIRNEVGRIANTIIDAGKLEDYGTPKCQEYLKKWAQEFGDPRKAKAKSDPSESGR